MRTIEDTFKNADFLQPKVYNRYKLGAREEIKEMFIKSFEYYDRTVEKYEHLPAYDEIIDWMVDTKGRGLMLMGECGLGKSTILNFVIPAIFRTKTNKILRSVPAKELGAVDRNKAPFIIIDDLGTESIKNDYGTKIDAVADAISYAEDSSKTLLITTNLTPQALKERYDERTLDRLRKCKVVIIKGKSFRN
jgi:DNA replication protein DnaC|tara:strand:- start:1535 stop:2110 length:576 start_codon:yes stop_codon:yes gene_type:complete